MEIDKIWQRIRDESARHSSELLLIQQLKESKNPIRKLRKNLAWNIGFYIAGIAAAVYLMLYFPALSLRIVLGILVLQSLFFSWKMYQRIKAFDQLLEGWDQPILITLRAQLLLTRGTLKMMEMRSMLFMPFAYLAGLLIGGSSKGGNADALIMDFLFLAKGMGIALLTLPPLYFLLKWMHKKAFVEFIEQTENLLKEWED
jgi:hypothetical protein